MNRRPWFLQIRDAKDRILSPIVNVLPRWVHPDHITVLRGFFIAPIVLVIGTGHVGWGFILYLLATFTDLFDGVLARKTHRATYHGTIFDPVVSKFLFFAILFSLGWKMMPHSMLWVLFGLELVYGAIAVLLQIHPPKNHVLPARQTSIGKSKSMVVFAAILLLFLATVRPIWIYASMILFAVTIVLTILELEIDVQKIRFS